MPQPVASQSSYSAATASLAVQSTIKVGKASPARRARSRDQSPALRASHAPSSARGSRPAGAAAKPRRSKAARSRSARPPRASPGASAAHCSRSALPTCPRAPTRIHCTTLPSPRRDGRDRHASAMAAAGAGGDADGGEGESTRAVKVGLLRQAGAAIRGTGPAGVRARGAGPSRVAGMASGAAAGDVSRECGARGCAGTACACLVHMRWSASPSRQLLYRFIAMKG